MKRIIWNDQVHSVGNKLIDAQRKKIAGAINKLIALSESEFKRASLIRELMKINMLALNHFSTEMSVLRERNVSTLNHHILSHERFSERISGLVVNCKCNKQDLESALTFFENWWATHVSLKY